MRRRPMALFVLAVACSASQGASVFSVGIASGGGGSLLITAVGGTLQLHATPLDSAGHAVGGVPVTWASGNTAVATVDGTGLVTAVSNGTADITASAEGAFGRTTITVAQAPDSIAVTPPSASIERGATAPFSAAVTDPRGHSVANAVVTWTSSDDDIATIGADGVATGNSAGEVTITATSGAKSATATLDVTVPAAGAVSVSAAAEGPLTSLGDTRQLAATATDSRGAPLPEAVFTWSSSDEAVATVSAAGLVTAKKNGSATITAASGSASGTLGITVAQALHTVSVTPPAQSIAPDALFTFTAHLLDANSHPLDSAPSVAWAIADSGVATIDAGTGEVHGNALATALVSATVRATAGAIFGEATLTIDPAMAPVTSIDLPQPAGTLTSIGDHVQLTATAKNQAGNAVPDVVFSWSSDHTGVASVDPDSGLVTAKGNGAASVTASGGGKSASVTITVTQAVAAVVIDPPSATTLTSLDDTLQLGAAANDANGHAVAGAAITWSTSDGSIASVSNTGLVTAKGNGASVTITAASGAFHDDVALAVQQAIHQVNVTPSADAVPPDSTEDFSASAVDAHGHLVAGAGTAVFDSDNHALVSFTGGHATIGHTGVQVVVNVTATIDGVVGTAQLTVDPALIPVDHVSAISVTSGSTPMASIGETVQLSAQAQDASNGALPNPITWSVQDGSAEVVTVNASSGLVTAKGNGTKTIVASAGGKSATIDVTVSQVLASVQIATAVAGASTTLTSFGDTLALQATGFDANNHALPPLAFTWRSDSAHAAADAGTGVVTAVSDGSANIFAKSGDVENLAGFAVTVAQAVDHITVDAGGASTTLASIGDQVQLAAAAFDGRGNPMDEVFAWTPTTGAAAVVDQSGLVTAVSNGTTSIHAAVSGKTGSLPVTVTQVAVSVSVSGPASLTSLGQTAQLSASAADANGHAVGNPTFSWRSDDTAFVTVDASSGVITAVAAGSANVFAKVGLIESDAYPITVTQAVNSISVTGSSTLTAIDATAQLSASPLDANANPVPGVSITWSIQDGSTNVITVSGAGVVTAVGPGQRTVVASGGGKSGSLAVTVSQAPANVSVSTGGGSTSFVSIGDTLQLTASATDANGHAIAGQTFTWRSDSVAHATVSSAGLVTAVANGSANIFAKAGNAESAAVAVTLAQVVASVTVSPATATLSSFDPPVHFTAAPKDARGNAVAGAPAAAWDTSNHAVATVDASGNASRGTTAGSTTVTGTVSGKSGTATLTNAGY